MHVDGDQGIKGVVTAIIWQGRGDFPMYEVSWITNGVPQAPYVGQDRLTPA